jgi:hypothetical protein
MTTEGYLVHASKAVPEFIDIRDVEFLKRFFEHIVPPGFRRIRHLEFLSSRNKAKSLETIRKSLNVAHIHCKRTRVEVLALCCSC